MPWTSVEIATSLPEESLPVAVSVKDQIFGGVSEAGAQRRAVALIDLVMNNLDERQLSRHLVQDRRSGITASVVDYDHLVVIC